MDALINDYLARLATTAYAPSQADYEFLRMIGRADRRDVVQRVIDVCASAPKLYALRNVAKSYLEWSTEHLPRETTTTSLAEMVELVRNDIHVKLFNERPMANAHLLMDRPVFFMSAIGRVTQTDNDDDVKTALARWFSQYLDEHYDRDQLIATIVAMCICQEEKERRLQRLSAYNEQAYDIVRQQNEADNDDGT